MKTRPRFALLAVALLALVAAPAAFADHHEKDDDMMMGKANPARDAMLADYGRATGHLVDLANAMPADKYSWRPADGVRSVSEVFMHVAAANFHISATLGIAPPDDVPENLEGVTDKAEVVAWLEKSIDHGTQAIESIEPKQLGEEHDIFGRSMSTAMILLILDTHSHEHLGQAIAYARSNGVVPPWSQPQGDG
jgi:uncharacterized damage-inducible protein DinB